MMKHLKIFEAFNQDRKKIKKANYFYVDFDMTKLFDAFEIEKIETTDTIEYFFKFKNNIDTDLLELLESFEQYLVSKNTHLLFRYNKKTGSMSIKQSINKAVEIYFSKLLEGWSSQISEHITVSFIKKFPEIASKMNFKSFSILLI